MFIQWSKTLEIGHPIIDYDHQMLFNMANDLYHAVKFDQGDSTVTNALQLLINYIETHFAREEALFTPTPYPHSEKHIQNHREIEHLLASFLSTYIADPDTTDMSRLLVFFKAWLIRHVGKLDRSYARYVAEAEQQSWLGKRQGFV